MKILKKLSLIEWTVLILPFFILPQSIHGDNIRQAKWWLPLVIGLVLITRQVYKKLGIMWALFFGYPAFLWMLYGNETHGVLDMMLILLTCSFICYWKTANKERILDIIGWSGLPLALLGALQLDLLQNFPYKPVDIDYARLPVGMMGHSTLFGPWMVVCAAILFSRHKSPKDMMLRYSAAVCCLMTAALTKSTMTIVSIVALLGILMWWRAKPWVTVAVTALGLIGISLAAYLYFPEFYSLTGRGVVWKRAFEVICQATPWNFVGYGPGSWFGLYEQLGIPSPEKWAQLHNDWLQNVFEYGYLGAAYMFLVLGAAIRVAFKRVSFVYAAIFWVLAVNAIGNFPMRVMPHGMLFAVVTYEILSLVNPLHYCVGFIKKVLKKLNRSLGVPFSK